MVRVRFRTEELRCKFLRSLFDENKLRNEEEFELSADRKFFDAEAISASLNFVERKIYKVIWNGETVGVYSDDEVEVCNREKETREKLFSFLSDYESQII